MILKNKLYHIYEQLALILSQLKFICATTFSTLPQQINKIVVGDNKLPSYFNDSIQEITSSDLNGVTIIDDEMFKNRANLMSLETSDSVIKIQSSAFRELPNLQTVVIGNSVTNIDSYAFYNCDKLTNVTIGNSVTNIGSYAFANCDNLTNVTIGNSVTSIGSNAFYWCKKLTNLVIPDSVTTIDTYAFGNNTGLNSIYIGKGIKNIGTYAFYGCSYVYDLYIYATTPPQLATSNSIGINPYSGKIHVPIGSGDAYKSATNWSSLASRIVEDIEI